MCEENRVEEYAIEVNHISKSYKMFKDPSDRLKQTFSKRKLYKEFWALHDIDFKIPKGSVIGIVGRNGSGKSTLLQILAGTLEPTSGNYSINGKIAALLELGSGFNPEYTGRENVYMCGSIYGITKDEMDKRIKKIEEFADIGAFIDQPVKSYSSGMFARLAFAVNVNVDADILIVDEVLSVGDHFFQAKCMSEINTLMKKGITILLVSHSQATIKALCSKAILLHEGNLIAQGDCDSVMDSYMAICLSEEREYQKQMALINCSGDIAKKDTNDKDSVENYKQDNIFVSEVQPNFDKRITERFGNNIASFIEATMYQNGLETVTLKNREKCKISVWVKANQDVVTNSEVGIVVRTFEGIDLFALNPFFVSKYIEPFSKNTVLKIDFVFDVNLGAGKYSVTLGMRSPVQGEYVDKVFNAIIFDVIDSTSRTIPLLFEVPFEMRISEEC